MKRAIAFIVCALMMLNTVVYADCRVITLMYHNVTTDASRWDDWCVSPEQLEEDINYFKEHGYIPITASELATEDMENLDGRKILLLTFDDGYVGWYNEVFPILERTGTKATMFIVGSYIGRYGYLGEEQINEIANSGLVEIGNHTNYIHQMPLEALKTMYENGRYDEIAEDIKGNGELIEKITGKEVTSIAWPYGYASEGLDRYVKSELGYKISFGTEYGVNVYNGDTSYLFNRINRRHIKTPYEILSSAEARFKR